MFVAGLDGGGTKTCVEIRTLENKAKCRKTFGAFNVNSTPKKEIERTVYDIVEYLKSITGNIDDCKSICIGTAGISNPIASEILKENFIKNGYKNQLQIIGDHEIALYGALESNIGIGLISGTGSICFGTNEDGKSHRVGGWGHILDDKGSGYDIGKEVLSAVLQSYDKRIPETILQKLVFEKLNISSVNQLIAYVHNQNTTKKDIADFAPLLDMSVTQGDKVSIMILENICDSLVKMVNTVFDVLDMKTSKLAMLGSILNHSECVRNMFIEKLNTECPCIIPTEAKNDAATGASMLSLKNYT